jgi:branched-chain amino acid transport system ATP-binding protein
MLTTGEVHRMISPAQDVPLLEVVGVKVRFGGTQALRGVTLRLFERSMSGLIGPNGAGKSTLFDVITGFSRPSEGRVLLQGRDVSRQSPHARARYGLRRTFQNGELFDDLTVSANLEVASGSARSDLVEAILRTLNLQSVRDRLCRELPAAIRKKVGIARAAAGAPKLLLLDEVASGISAAEVGELAAQIRALCSDLGCALLLVEHDMAMIRAICEYVYVLDEGLLLAHGTMKEIDSNERVRTAYLGDDGIGEIT